MARRTARKRVLDAHPLLCHQVMHSRVSPYPYASPFPTLPHPSVAHPLAGHKQAVRCTHCRLAHLKSQLIHRFGSNFPAHRSSQSSVPRLPSGPRLLGWTWNWSQRSPPIGRSTRPHLHLHPPCQIPIFSFVRGPQPTCTPDVWTRVSCGRVPEKCLGHRPSILPSTAGLPACPAIHPTIHLQTGHLEQAPIQPSIHPSVPCLPKLRCIRACLLGNAHTYLGTYIRTYIHAHKYSHAQTTHTTHTSACPASETNVIMPCSGMQGHPSRPSDQQREELGFTGSHRWGVQVKPRRLVARLRILIPNHTPSTQRLNQSPRFCTTPGKLHRIAHPHSRGWVPWPPWHPNLSSESDRLRRLRLQSPICTLQARTQHDPGPPAPVVRLVAVSACHSLSRPVDRRRLSSFDQFTTS